MRIKYTGTIGLRIVDGYAWSAENGRVQDVVEPDLILNLLTHEGFSVADDEPLLQLLGSRDLVGKLVVEQPGLDMAFLASLKKKEIKSLADSLGVTPAEVEAWVTSARMLVEPTASALQSSDSGVFIEDADEPAPVEPVQDDGG